MAFHIIQGAEVVLRQKGVYRQSKVYQRGPHLYAALGGGFVKLYSTAMGTSRPDVSYEDLLLPFRPIKGATGVLEVPASVTPNDESNADAPLQLCTA